MLSEEKLTLGKSFLLKTSWNVSVKLRLEKQEQQQQKRFKDFCSEIKQNNQTYTAKQKVNDGNVAPGYHLGY